MKKEEDLGENTFKRTRSDADFSARKRVKSETKNKQQLSDEQELLKYLEDWPTGHSIRVRDGSAREEEIQGVLSWQTIYNDGTAQNFKLLCQLKQIISVQLPNMPKNYIMRLVFDFQHKSLVGLKNGKVIGGITFRPFNKEGYVPFIEVVFCVITKSEQRGGYGSRLMNRLKHWCQQNDNVNLLTYADDSAIGYFQRQGFTLDIGMETKDWDIGFLKYYDSATLMHCAVDMRIDYLEINHQIRLQRATFCKKMRQLSHQHQEYEGIKKFDRNRESYVDPMKIQGLIESGWTTYQLDKLLEKDNQDRIYKENKAIIEAIKSNTSLCEPFAKPVVELYPKLASTYLETIPDPIDLRTISEKLERRCYICPEMLLADLQRMVENCKNFLKAIYVINKQKAPEKDPLYLQAESLSMKYLEQKRIELGIPAIQHNTEGEV